MSFWCRWVRWMAALFTAVCEMRELFFAGVHKFFEVIYQSYSQVTKTEQCSMRKKMLRWHRSVFFRDAALIHIRSFLAESGMRAGRPILDSFA